MKKVLSSALVLFAMLAWTSCSDDDSLVGPSDEAAGKGKPQLSYTAASGSFVGNVFTFTIDQAGRQAISHVLLRAETCDGQPLPIEDYIIPVDSDIVVGTGNGTNCTMDGLFIKFDNVSQSGVATFTIEFGQEVSKVFIKVKSGQSCSEEILVSGSDNCCEEDCEPTCYSGESATSAGFDFGGSANWFQYSEYPGDGGSVDIVYGNNLIKIGEAEFTDNGDGTVTIDITLEGGVKLQALGNVKVKALTTEPGPDAKFPTGGQVDFQTTELTGLVANAAGWYYIHLDVSVPKDCD